MFPHELFCGLGLIRTEPDPDPTFGQKVGALFGFPPPGPRVPPATLREALAPYGGNLREHEALPELQRRHREILWEVLREKQVQGNTYSPLFDLPPEKQGRPHAIWMLEAYARLWQEFDFPTAYLLAAEVAIGVADEFKLRWSQATTLHNHLLEPLARASGLYLTFRDDYQGISDQELWRRCQRLAERTTAYTRDGMLDLVKGKLRRVARLAAQHIPRPLLYEVVEEINTHVTKDEAGNIQLKEGDELFWRIRPKALVASLIDEPGRFLAAALTELTGHRHFFRAIDALYGDRQAREAKNMEPDRWLSNLAQSTDSVARLVRDYLAVSPFTDAPHPLRMFLDATILVDFPEKARLEHMHIVAGSGHGKTQCLQNLILADLHRAYIARVEPTKSPRGYFEKRLGVVVIDSQGDLLDSLLHSAAHFHPNLAETNLASDLIYIDPTDLAHPIGLNLFDHKLERFAHLSAVERERIFNGTLEIYSYVFASLLGAELTQKQGLVFTYLARAMLTIPGATILTLRDFLEDGRRFSAAIEQLDGSARDFFERQFFTKTYEETRKQILTRLWGILANPVFERMFTHPKNTVDMYQALQDGKIVFINTAKELLKSEGASILGRFFIALIGQATLARANLPEDERTPCHLYIDEAQDYFDDKLGEMMNQARKYKVGITLAHQHLDQFALELRSSVLASTSIKLVGGVNAKDAATFAREMRCDPEYLLARRKHHDWSEFACYVRHVTPRAITVQVPFAGLGTDNRLTDENFERLLRMNRERLAPRRSRSLPRRTVTRGRREPPSPIVDDDADFSVS